MEATWDPRPRIPLHSATQERRVQLPPPLTGIVAFNLPSQVSTSSPQSKDARTQSKRAPGTKWGFTDNLFPSPLPFLPIIRSSRARWGRGGSRSRKKEVWSGAPLCGPRSLPQFSELKCDQAPKLCPRGSLQDHSQAILWPFLFNGPKAHPSLVPSRSPLQSPSFPHHHHLSDGPDGEPETGFILCHPSTPRAIPGVNRFSPEPKVGRSFTPFAAPAPSSESPASRGAVSGA